MGNIYELYYFYPTCIASGFIYELNYLYPAPSASGKHLLLTLVYTVLPNLSTCFFKFRNIFTISWLIICRKSVVKYKYQPSKLLENALFKPFYLSRLFIVGNNNTSLIAGELVSNITSLSIPYPIPPVGGIPIDKAFKKSSSVWLASSSPAAKAAS